MEKGIVIAGTMIVDIVKMINVYPEKGMLANITDMKMSVGGCVPNTIIDIARLDKSVPLKAYGCVGKDEYGDFLKKTLSLEGVDIQNLLVSEKLPTSFTDVMTVKSSGERTFFNTRGANSAYDIDNVDVEKLDCDIFHCGYLLLMDGFDREDAEYGTRLARLLKNVSDQGIKTSIDVVSESGDRFRRIVTPALKYCDYVILNEIEGGEITGISARDASGKIDVAAVEKILRRFFQLGVRECAVIHCPEAGFMVNARGEFTVVPSLKLSKDYIVGSVGAGDAFCAGMLYALYKGWSDSDCLRLGSLTAAANLSSEDSIGGARSLEDTQKLETLFKRREI